MKLSTQTIDYLESIPLDKFINSNIIITDLKKVIYTSTFSKSNLYISKLVSNDLLDLINYWNKMPISEDLFYLKNNPNMRLTINDTEIYDSLIIFPLYFNNNISGLSIFFRYTGTYTDKSLKAPNTIRKWIMKFMGNEIFPINKNIF